MDTCEFSKLDYTDRYRAGAPFYRGDDKSRRRCAVNTVIRMDSRLEPCRHDHFRLEQSGEKAQTETLAQSIHVMDLGGIAVSESPVRCNAGHFYGHVAHG